LPTQQNLWKEHPDDPEHMSPTTGEKTLTTQMQIFKRKECHFQNFGSAQCESMYRIMILLARTFDDRKMSAFLFFEMSGFFYKKLGFFHKKSRFFSHSKKSRQLLALWLSEACKLSIAFEIEYQHINETPHKRETAAYT
jgi:hypothetical protein